MIYSLCICSANNYTFICSKMVVSDEIKKIFSQKKKKLDQNDII